MSQDPANFDPVDMDGGFTTQAVGEEGDDDPTTMAVGEEGDDDPTTMAVGEEGDDDPTTMAVGEEGDDDPTTMAVGEEGDDDPTTMAVGEEGDDDPFADQGQGQDLGFDDNFDEFNQAGDDLGGLGDQVTDMPDAGGDWGDLAL